MRARKTYIADQNKYVGVKWSNSQCGKLAYPSRKYALSSAAVQRKGTGENIQAYKCADCHAWHIGHPWGAKAYQEQERENGQ